MPGWINEQLQAERIESERQQHADRTWKPKLEKWRSWLADASPTRRAAAEAALREVTDPRAVPSVWSVFAPGNASHQKQAVQLFAQIDAPAASRALALLAVSSPQRRGAQDRCRDPGPARPARLRGPGDRPAAQADQVPGAPVNGPGSTGAVFVEGEKFNVRRLYQAPALPAETLRLLANPELLTVSPRSGGQSRLSSTQAADLRPVRPASNTHRASDDAARG